VQSQQRAAKAWEEGRFKNSVIPVKDVNGLTILAKDEHMRPTTTMQSLGQLQPSFVGNGADGRFDAVAIQSHPEIERINYVHHAGNSVGIVDGAAAVLLGSKEAATKAGLKPRARIRAFANIGSEPAMMLTGAGRCDQEGAGAVRHEAVGHRSVRVVNEAFASVVLPLHPGFQHRHRQKSTSTAARSRSAIRSAPTGAMILGTVLDELERSNNIDRAGHRCASATAHGTANHHRKRI